MKLIFDEATRAIVATATDEYTGPDAFIDAPDDFDIERLSEYRVVDGQVVLPPPPPVTTVTMRKARLALLNAGLLDDVEAAIAAIPDETQRRAAQIEWEYASVVERDNPIIQQLVSALGMTEQQVDEFFAAADRL
jgi:hypothetical protein